MAQLNRMVSRKLCSIPRGWQCTWLEAPRISSGRCVAGEASAWCCVIRSNWSDPPPSLLNVLYSQGLFKVPACPWPNSYHLGSSFNRSPFYLAVFDLIPFALDLTHLFFCWCFWEPQLLRHELTSWEYSCFSCFSRDTDFLLLCFAVWLVKKCSMIRTTISSSSSGTDPGG